VSRPIWSDDHKRRRVLDVERHPEHDGRYFDSAADKDTYCVAHGLLKLRDADTSAV
jgi:hypothetical protein